jgi:hypothetical protein
MPGVRDDDSGQGGGSACLSVDSSVAFSWGCSCCAWAGGGEVACIYPYCYYDGEWGYRGPNGVQHDPQTPSAEGWLRRSP